MKRTSGIIFRALEYTHRGRLGGLLGLARRRRRYLNVYYPRVRVFNYQFKSAVLPTPRRRERLNKRDAAWRLLQNRLCQTSSFGENMEGSHAIEDVSGGARIHAARYAAMHDKWD